MRYVLILMASVLLLPIVFKEPSVNGQSKEPIITTPTIEQIEARTLGAENDKRSLAINKDIAIVTEQTVPNNRLRAEVLKYKKANRALLRENNYYKRKIVTLKKVLKTNYNIKEIEQDNISLYKKDTVYLVKPRKGFFKNIFN